MEKPLVTQVPDSIGYCSKQKNMGIDKPDNEDEIYNSQQSVVQILLVEDNPGDARLVREMLIEEGADQFQVKHVKQLSEAFEHLHQKNFDIILLDLSLPDGQGLDTLNRTHSVSPHVPIMVLTGLNDEAIAVQAVRKGAQDYLIKGEMDSKLLVRAIRYAIERNHLRIDLEARTQEVENREANFRNIIATNVDGMIILDTKGVVRFINPAAEVLFDTKAKEMLGQLFGFSVVAGETRELCIIRPTGEAPTAEMRVVETIWQGEKAYLASLRDITKRKEIEESQKMQLAVTDLLEQSDTLPEASFQILETIGKGLGWELGEVWLLAPNSKVLRLDSFWYDKPFSVADFDPSSRETTFLPGQGLLGRVWASGEPLWITDISTDINFPRIIAAIKNRLHAAFAFPIYNRSEAIGVIAFYSCYIRQPDHNLLQMMADISTQISQFIQRKQAEAAMRKINEELEIRVASRTVELKQINQELRREIVERNRAELALRKSEERFRQLVEQAADGFFLHDLEGRFIAVNQCACESLGYTREELLNLTLYDIEENLVSKNMDQLWEQIINGVPITLNGVHKRKDGTTFPVEVRIGAFELDKRPLMLALARDITERKKAEVEIRKALEKEKQLIEFKSRFITIASHEFRTPLTTILSAAEALQHYSYKWAEDKKLTYLLRIQGSVKHMTQLLNDVLIVAKAEAGKLEFQPQPLDLSEFCRELTEEMQLGSGNSHTITLVEVREHENTEAEINHQVSLPWMDEKLMRHIFSNLLSNAIKYSPPDTTVRFELLCQNEFAIFKIQDQGIGIPSEDTELMFESFHRSKNVGTIPGTGLGLAIVKNAVNVHGGSITVHSDVGVGTTFIVMLPLKNPTQLQSEVNRF